MLGYKKLLFVALVGISTRHMAAETAQDYESGRIRVAHILSNEETGVAACEKNILKAETQNLVQDLNTVAIAKFFGCKTVIGQTYLAETLKSPVSPKDANGVLEKRQHIIRTLVNNPDLKKEIEKLLEAAKIEEQEVIQLMSEFFIGKSCSELKELELIKQQYPYAYPLNKFIIMNPTAKTAASAINVVSAASMGVMGVVAGYMAYLSTKIDLGIDESPAKLALASAYFASLGAYMSYLNYKDYTAGAEKRLKMHALNRLIEIAEKLEGLFQTYSISSQFKISDIKDPKGVELVEGLKHVRYKDKNSTFFMYPFVHTFLYKVYQEDKHLAEVLMSIAEIDAYNAIATKIIESHDEKNKFCFVNFIQNDKPFIDTQAFWNVLVKDAVSSNLTESRHTILTGPNAGGKTTTIRALLQNIVLGQTFGVAAAESFNMTQFDVIYSYMNISDDLLNGLSLFASEVKRAQEILQRIKALEPNKKFFFALDELFTGTVAEDGEVCAYEFVKRIASFEGVQFIYSTHFNKLKELGDNHERCVNYKVDAPTKNADNKLVYPYTLSKGANHSNVALDLAREAQLFE